MALVKRSLATVTVLIATALALTFSAAGVLNSYQTLPSGGTLTSVNVGVYSNSACTQNITYVGWGSLKPGDTVTRTVWVKNIGTARTTLSLTTSNWSPSNAYPSISLSWNRQNKALAPGETVQAILTLTVSSSVDVSITAFSFNIVITGTG